MTDFPWKKEDVIRVLKYIADGSPYVEDYFSCDYCIYCNAKIGNAELALKDSKEFELHRKNCIYILAQDMLTGIKD